MLLGLFGVTTPWAFAILVAGAATLSALLVLAVRDRQRFAPLLAVLGLYLIAAALEVLKDRTLSGYHEGYENFTVVRNSFSLALVAVPLALALLIHPSASCRRTTAAVIGMLGAILLLIAAAGWRDSLSEERHLWIEPARSNWAWPLARDGNLASARWLWCVGAVMLALPTMRSLLRRRRGLTMRGETDLAWTLGGLSLSSAAMAIFFWYQDDLRHREYAYDFMTLVAYLSPLLVLGETRIRTARWVQHILGGFGVALAAWTLIGMPGSTYSSGTQDLSDLWLTMLLYAFLLLMLPLLAGHLLLRAAVLAVRRRRAAFK